MTRNIVGIVAQHRRHYCATSSGRRRNIVGFRLAAGAGAGKRGGIADNLRSSG
jgi:hypothetical protein